MTKIPKKQSLILIICLAVALAIVVIISYIYLGNTTDQSSINSNESSKVFVEDSSEYLSVPEWDIKVKTTLSDSIEYSVQSRNGGPQNTNYEYLGLRFKADSFIDDNCLEPGIDVYRQLVEPTFDFIKIDSFYYYVTGAPGLCSEDNADIDLQSTLIDQLKLNNISLL